jgi:hypothetical protein
MWNQSISDESRIRLNDDERELWVNNNECLYQAYIAFGQTIRVYIKANRSYIDAHASAVLEGGQA